MCLSLACRLIRKTWLLRPRPSFFIALKDLTVLALEST
jgi:hypothetical protein